MPPFNNRGKPTIHTVLRHATSRAHSRVDAVFGQFELSATEEYVAFLSAHAAALLPIEAWLDDRAAALTPDWCQHKRGAALARDLAVLGAPVPQGIVFTAPEARAAVAGVLYVVEGSRLGGRVLAERLPPHLPRAYLDPPQAVSRWPALLARLEDALTDDEAGQAMAIGAALAVFTRFEQAGCDWHKQVPV